ncbi:MAG: hypothetical protein ACFFA4_06910 [Promethearchaeota archaeon]
MNTLDKIDEKSTGKIEETFIHKKSRLDKCLFNSRKAKGKQEKKK